MKTAKNIAMSSRATPSLRTSIVNAALLGLLLCHAGCAGMEGEPARSPGSPFEAVSEPNGGPPMLRLDNASDIEANVDCSGESSQSISIPPGTQREVRLPAGRYSCMLYGGTATPTTWTQTYRENMAYEVKLYTADHYLPVSY